MGIYNFFGWFKNNFTGAIKKIPEGKNFEFINVEIDNLLIDMNGLFHNSTQKIYQYGNFKPRNPSYLLKNKNISDNKLQLRVFEDICKNVEILVNLTKPNKRLIMAVDGTAPFSKQVQMRRRRFRSALERDETEMKFDPNCISPGTKFMDHLSRYIDWFIRKKASEDPVWKNLEIIFSNEKVPGEGEQKLLNYIRKYGNPEESYCLQGLDADLIMLGLSTHYPKFYILREDQYDITNKYFVIDTAAAAMQLSEIMRWESKTHRYDEENAIDDFIFLCFMAGNDFLPHIPSIEILESGIEIILSAYRDVGTLYGHIILNTKDNTTFNKQPLKVLFEIISQYEKPVLEKKVKNKGIYFEDPLLDSCSKIDSEHNYILDIEKYRTDYSEKCFGKNKKVLKKVCHDYLEGLQWVITYYKKSCSNWKYYYPYDYAPSAYFLAEHIMTFKTPNYEKTKPFTLFQQLISVLPPKSSELLPTPLNNLLLDDESPLKEFCPEKFEIDLAGKKRDYQGIVKIPMLDPEIVIKAYYLRNKEVDERELKRNAFGKTYIYKYHPMCNMTFNSYYGNLNSKVNLKILML
jgi:5'-3' exoribonuclease 1